MENRKADSGIYYRTIPMKIGLIDTGTMAIRGLPETNLKDFSH